jgi:hypothetical protein
MPAGPEAKDGLAPTSLGYVQGIRSEPHHSQYPCHPNLTRVSRFVMPGCRSVCTFKVVNIGHGSRQVENEHAERDGGGWFLSKPGPTPPRMGSPVGWPALVGRP